MAWSLVQSKNTTPTTSTSLAASFGSNVTAGNRIILYTGLFAGVISGTDVNTPTDNQGNTYTKLVGGTITASGVTQFTDIWTAVASSTGTLTITVTAASQTGLEIGWTAEEYSGLDGSAGSGCLDKSAAGTGNNNSTANASSGTTAATTGANQLGVSAVTDWGTSATWTVSSGGFTKNAGASIDANATMSIAAGGKTSASGATENCTWTNGAVADTDVAVVAVIKLAAAGGGGQGPSMPSRPLRRGRRARYRRWQWAQPSSGIQVTAAQGGVTGNGIALRVFVLTGFGGTGGTFSANLAASTTDTGSITTSAGSNVYGASVRAQPTGVSTGSGATVLDDITDSGNGAHYVTLKSLGVGAGAASRGYTSTVSAAADLALLEITSGGSLAEDSSSPAAVSDTAHTQVTTALFSPPLGAALVALVASNGGAGVTTMTVSDSTGLTWTEGPHSNPSSTGYAGVWTAGLPTGPPPGVATLTASIDFTAPPAVIEQAIATLAAAASITAPVSAQLAPATLQPVFTVNSPAVTQLAPATLAPAFTVAGPVSTQLAPATLQVAGSVTAPVSTLIQNIVTTLSAAWSLTSPAVQLAPATLLPAFSVTSPAMRELAPATLAATFAVSSPVSTLIVPATLSAAWSVSDTAILLAPATLAAVFAITSPDAALVAPASMIITGSLTGSAGQGAALTAGFTLTSPAQQLAPATLAGSFTISSPAVQDAPAVLAAGLAVAAPDVSLRAPATLQAAASLASVPAILAPATLAAQSVLTASAQQLAPASLTAQVTLNSPAAVQREAAVLAAAFALSTQPPPVQGAVTLQPAWSLTAAGIMIPLQLVSGLRAGEAHIAWRAGEAHIMWDAGEAHIAWDAGESYMAEYAAGRAHVAWLAGEAHT